MEGKKLNKKYKGKAIPENNKPVKGITNHYLTEATNG